MTYHASVGGGQLGSSRCHPHFRLRLFCIINQRVNLCRTIDNFVAIDYNRNKEQMFVAERGIT